MWNQTSQPASHSTETESKLLVNVGASCASRAALGSLFKRSSNVFVVNIFAPAGWMIDFVGSWMAAFLAGAVDIMSDTFAAESTNAVLSRLGGLVQPES